jgi:Zn-dependent M16 (insulinase) family peptidase
VRSFPILSVRGGAALAVAPASGAGVPADVSAAIVAKLRASRDEDGAGVPFWANFVHVSSAFVSVAVAIDTSALATRQRAYLPLLLALLFKLPCTLDDGTQLSKDEFVAALQADTVRYSASTGLVRAPLSQLACVFVQTELGPDADGLARALTWARRALYLTTITAEAVKMAVQKELAQIPAQVRNGSGIAREVHTHLELDAATSNSVGATVLVQRPFLTALATQLETDAGAKAAVADLVALRSSLTTTAKLDVFVAADHAKLTASPFRELRALVPPRTAPTAAPPPPPASEPIGNVRECGLLSGRHGQAVVTALSAIESNFLVVSAAGIGPYSPDHAALLVAIEHLTALEGDFWVKLRGAGLTYSYRISFSTASERIQFVLFKCADLLGAYLAAKAIVAGYASGESAISDIALAGAKSTVAYSVISSTATRLSAAAAQWESNYEGKGVDYGKWLLAQVDEVTPADALHALKKYVVPLFDASANLSATCPTNKLDAVADGLRETLGVDVAKHSEDELFTAFAMPHEPTPAGPTAPTQPAKRPRLAASGGAFGFAKQFKCECPKCGPKDEPSV